MIKFGMFLKIPKKTTLSLLVSNFFKNSKMGILPQLTL